MTAGKGDRVFVSVHQLLLMQPLELPPEDDQGLPLTVPPDASLFLFCRWDDHEGCPLPFAGAVSSDRDHWDEIGSLRFEALFSNTGARVALPEEEKDRVRRFLSTRCPDAEVEFLSPDAI